MPLFHLIPTTYSESCSPVVKAFPSRAPLSIRQRVFEIFKCHPNPRSKGFCRSGNVPGNPFPMLSVPQDSHIWNVDLCIASYILRIMIENFHSSFASDISVRRGISHGCMLRISRDRSKVEWCVCLNLNLVCLQLVCNSCDIAD